MEVHVPDDGASGQRGERIPLAEVRERGLDVERLGGVSRRRPWLSNITTSSGPISSERNRSGVSMRQLET